MLDCMTMRDIDIHLQSIVAYVGLGANLGDSTAAVRAAINTIDQVPQVSVIRASSLYCTAPMHSTGPDYINAVIGISCSLPAYDLLRQLQKIENAALRDRPYRNAPRTLDLDLLLYGDAWIDSEALTVPHPRMWGRAFVLLPLQEIAPELVSAELLVAVQGQQVTRLADI